ncbi:MAG: pilin glycosylation ligase domain-containing protein, partial [Neisseria subflava]|nr:pilin glycosylation ligase domain-containing protein [Neisseria subflava]
MTYHTLSDGLTESSVKTFWPLWLSFIWICAVPFLSLYRVGPLPSFYLEAISLSGSLVLTLISAHKGLLNIRLPTLSIGLFAMAAFWLLQARLMHSTYPGMSDITAWTFVILALGAWSVRGWVAAYGQERVVSIFAWSLLIGATIQASIVWLQFKGWSNVEWLNGIIARSNGTVNGQLGQRNHLGHYLMWGILAASYLWTARKMSNTAGFLFVLALTATLGLVNSRTILGYIAALFLITPLWFWRTRFQHKRALCIFLLTAILAAAFQFGMGSLLD